MKKLAKLCSKALTNRVEVGTARWREQQADAFLLAELLERLAVMIGCVVHDQHSPLRVDGPSSYFPDEFLECVGVVDGLHWPFVNERIEINWKENIVDFEMV